jgi:hypothetical protein
MNSKKEGDTYRLAPWLERQILADLESGNVVRFPNSWLKKLRRSRSHIIVAIAGVIVKLSEENADGTVMLPRHLSEEKAGTATMLPRNRQLLAHCKQFNVPYDGLGAQSEWRRTLLQLEHFNVVSIAWRKDFALVTPIHDPSGH